MSPSVSCDGTPRLRRHAALERQHPAQEVELVIGPLLDLADVLRPGYRPAQHYQQHLGQRMHHFPRLSRVVE